MQKLSLQQKEYSLKQWEDIITAINNPECTVTIAVVGKYTELNDAYKSIYEALSHAGIANRSKVVIKKVDSEDEETLLK